MGNRTGHGPATHSRGIRAYRSSTGPAARRPRVRASVRQHANLLISPIAAKTIQGRTPFIGHLSNIQILRGIAAVMVLVYHIGNEFGDRGFPEPLPHFWMGSAGVDVFFVISGFIMVHSTAEAFARPGAPWLFLARRLVRLAPLYWLITTIFVVVALVEARHTGLAADAPRWFAASYAFLFYPHGDAGDFPLYAQGWTLNFEMFFYVCFAAVLPFRRTPALWALVVGFAGLVTLGLVTPLPWPVDRWANTNIVEFILGLALAEVYRRGLRLRATPALLLAAAGFATFALTIGSVDAWLPYRGLVWGPPASAIVAAAALHRPRRGGAVRGALEALGDASYSLYLVHYAFFVALGDALSHVVPVERLPAPLYGGLCFCGAIALAFATYHGVERPMTWSLNRAFGLARRWRAPHGGSRRV